MTSPALFRGGVVDNPTVIAHATEVLSLEHRRWMTAEEFMEEMKNPIKS